MYAVWNMCTNPTRPINIAVWMMLVPNRTPLPNALKEICVSSAACNASVLHVAGHEKTVSFVRDKANVFLYLHRLGVILAQPEPVPRRATGLHRRLCCRDWDFGGRWDRSRGRDRDRRCCYGRLRGGGGSLPSRCACGFVIASPKFAWCGARRTA